MRCRTIFVAGLPEGLSLGENDCNDEILEGGDIEEAGVLKVLDVVLVQVGAIQVGHIQV